jgi:hypothetical protein
MADTVARVWAAPPANERARAGLAATHYGQAGALAM